MKKGNSVSCLGETYLFTVYILISHFCCDLKLTCYFIIRVNFRYQKAGMEMVKLRDMEDWETLPLTKWNIKQPYLKDVRENALDAGDVMFI